jgi:hypothetical protein
MQKARICHVSTERLIRDNPPFSRDSYPARAMHKQGRANSLFQMNTQEELIKASTPMGQTARLAPSARNHTGST